MDKQNEYDPLFSELKDKITFDQHTKKQALHHIKTKVPLHQTTKKKFVTPLIVSISTIIVAASLALLLINERTTDLTSIDQPNETEVPTIEQPNETTDPTLNETPPLTENQTVFNVESFGSEQLQLKNDILLYLDNLKLRDYISSEVFDTAKIDENGVAIINFSSSFMYAYGNSTTFGAGYLMRALNWYVFSYNEVQTVYYLLDGNASAWNEWLQFVDEPVTRVMYEQSKKDELTREFVEKNAKIGFSYDEVREVFGHEYHSEVMDNTMTFVYDSTTYKPFEYNRSDDAVAFDEIKLEQLDYQLFINFWDEKAVYYQYYFKGEDGEVWGYTISEQGDNLTRNSGN